MTPLQRVKTWRTPWRQIALLILLVLFGSMVGCATVRFYEVRPTFELRDQPANMKERPLKCSGPWRECLGQLWLGVKALFE